MSQIPVVPHHDVDPGGVLVARAESLARKLVREDPELTPSPQVSDLIAEHLDDSPALHFDDLGDIPLIERFHSVLFLQDRARLRAGGGDIVASCALPTDGFAEYAEHELGLGAVTWLHPVVYKDPLRVARACWLDREVRHALVHALRTDGLRYIHPNMGSPAVWVTARLLRDSSRRPLSVIAPPPALTRRVNDKIWFTEIVERLFGPGHVPRTIDVYNYTTLAAAVWRLLGIGSKTIVVKIPDSAGGSGNVVLDADDVRSDSIAGVRRRLKETLEELPWRPGARLLVGVWESEVRSAPSAQIWIPPEGDGLPIVEGVFEQSVGGPRAEFRGSRPAQLPAALLDEFATRSWLLARVFQRLRYVGRCSFDAIVVGAELASSRLEFVECNGRWGGTSTPMTLVNRLCGDWKTHPYVAHRTEIPGLQQRSFGDVLAWFKDDLFDARIARGSLVFFNPGRVQARSQVDVLAFADTVDAAEHRVLHEVPARLEVIVSGNATVSPEGR